MKALTRCLVFVLLLLPLCAFPLNVVGYYNYTFYPGNNLFHNGLLAITNSLSEVVPTAPEGTTVSLWNPTANAFQGNSVFSGGSWSLDLSLFPGTGARLTTSTQFINTFVGSVLNHDGTPVTDPEFPLPAPPFAGPNGIYLLGDKFPTVSSGNALFENILGRVPNIGEQVTRLDASTQTYITSTYLGGGNWNIPPQIRVGEAAFFNIGPVPEPSVAALGLLGVALFRASHRRKV